ncbi:MAG: hypothetical protein F9K49_04830 [Caedimonadaceae bacterium]|nr:MAG: hypothetical protein F9K49_04830 [Caedimonadaceae bacterium]
MSELLKKLEPKPEPKKIEPKKESKPEVKKDKEKPKEKKKEKNDKVKKRFSSLLKNLAESKDTSSENKDDATKDSESSPKTGDAGVQGDRLTMSELDAVRKQLGQCWNLPAGAKDAKGLRVEIKVWINADATVKNAEIVDTGRLTSDPFYQAAADSALRAVKSPKCNPLKLPLDKYESWKVTIITFDPQKMF